MDMLSVWSLVYCLTETEGLTWRPDDYMANKIKKTIKGESINKYFDIVIDKRVYRFNNANKNEFLPILYETLAEQLKNMVQTPSELVPIPNKSAIIGNDEDNPTLIHARAVAAFIPDKLDVCDAFRWKEASTQAHKGGHRNPQLHAENLKIKQKPSKPVFLFDDLITSGSQMIACSRRLVKAGCPLVAGIVFGRNVKDQKPDVVKWESHDIIISEHPLKWQF